jgi:hypothetical protein
MKALKQVILAVAVFCAFHDINAQTINWNALENSNHIITAGMGWDYSVSYSLGYAYHVKTKVPILLTSNFSIPSGEQLFDDFKTKIGAQMLLLNKPNLKSAVIINGIYRRYENPLVRLQNFGTEIRGTFGYYKPTWFVAGELGFDKAIATNFRHSESFKQNIFPSVRNGWYEPATGGNFQFGVQTGYSLKKSDINFNIGIVTTQDLKTTPLIPYFLMLGYNLRLD